MDNREPQVLDPLMASQHEYVRSNEYCYDRENKNLLVRFSDDGTIEKYVYGNGLIASYETAISEADGTPVTKYQTYVYDIRGSVILAVDAAGNTTAEYQYSTYGDRSVISGPDNDELGYCARDGVLTEQSGLLYMRARYYYPELMRFINQDIVTGDISNSSSLNRYAYVNGNPVTLIDPFGLCAERADKNSRAWKWGTDLFKTAAGVCLLFVPGGQVFGAGLIMNGATGLIMDTIDACGNKIDPKTGAIISDSVQIVGGIACLLNPTTAAYGVSQISSGVGGLAGGFIAEGLYNGYIGGDYGETAFVIGNNVGNIVGDLVGSISYEDPKPKSNSLGKTGEDYVSEELGLPHNNTTINVNGRDRIPDFYDFDTGIIAESKNVAKLSYTSQLRDYVDIAADMGTQLELYVRQNTQLSKPLQNAIENGLINLNFFPW